MKLIRMLLVAIAALVSPSIQSTSLFAAILPPANNMLYDITPPGTFSGGFTNKGNWGFDFTTTSTINVASLGLWDAQSDGLNGPHSVGLWRTNDALLVSATVDNTSTVVPSANASGRWLFTKLDAPLTLPAGAYTLSFYNPAGAGADQFFNGMSFSYLAGASYNTAKATSNAGSFGRPGTNSGANGGWIGANLQTAVPEPSSVVLGGLAAVGLLLVARRRRTSPRRSVPVLLAMALTLCVAGAAQATPVTVSGTTTVTNVLSGHTARFAVGDKFDFSLVYNDTATDSNSATSSGNFFAALTSMSLTRYATNTGSWNPASGTFSSFAPVGTSTLGNGQIIFSASGLGFPSSGTSFHSVIINLGGSNAPPLVTDTGLGQTLAAQLGGVLSGDISRYNTSSAMRIRFNGDEGSIIAATLSLTSLHVAGVPEPTSFALAGSAAVGLLIAARRRRCSTRSR